MSCILYESFDLSSSYPGPAFQADLSPGGRHGTTLNCTIAWEAGIPNGTIPRTPHRMQEKVIIGLGGNVHRPYSIPANRNIEEKFHKFSTYYIELSSINRFLIQLTHQQKGNAAIQQ